MQCNANIGKTLCKLVEGTDSSSRELTNKNKKIQTTFKRSNNKFRHFTSEDAQHNC